MCNFTISILEMLISPYKITFRVCSVFLILWDFYFPDMCGFFLFFRNDLLFFVPDIKKAILTNHWSKEYNNEFLNIKNAQNRNRTSDTRIFSPLLYRLSYLGIWQVLNTMDGEGFEPSKASPADLQSVPFGHSGIHPSIKLILIMLSHY